MLFLGVRTINLSYPNSATPKKEIAQYLETWKSDIEKGKLCVFMLDECHLLWGDLCGYIWGKRDRRIEVEMTNQKQRQTYYGALD